MTSFTASLLKPRIIAITIAGILTLWIIFRLFQNPSEGIIQKEFEQIRTEAHVAGELTAQYLDNGSQVILISYPPLSETLEKQTMAFKEGLLQQGKVTLIATEVIQPSVTPGTETFTLADVLRIHQAYPAADALISLIGAPGGKLHKPDPALPLIVALNSEPMDNAEQLFNLGIVQMALIPDLSIPLASDPSATKTDDSSFIITTVDNVRAVLR